MPTGVGGCTVMAGNVVSGEFGGVLLGRDGAEPFGGQVRARPGTVPCAEIVLRARHRHVGGRLGHRRVAHDGPGHLDGTERRHGNGDEATHAVADDDGRTVDARVVCNGEPLTGPLLELVAPTVTAVTEATQVD